MIPRFEMLALLMVLLLSGCASQELLLGYCPTMQARAGEIVLMNKNIAATAYGSSAEAFAALQRGEVDLVLAGRPALKRELSEAAELKLRNGHTLVSREKRFVMLDSLAASRIHTAHDLKTVREYIPDAQQPVLHATTADAIMNGLDEMVFISWDEYTEELELAVPLDRSMNKAERFRLPVIYALDRSIISRITVRGDTNED